MGGYPVMVDLSCLARIAREATSSCECKWLSNQELISWFRADPVAVIEALQSAQAVKNYPGGVSNQRLYASLDALPELKKGDWNVHAWCRGMSDAYPRLRTVRSPCLDVLWWFQRPVSFGACFYLSCSWESFSFLGLDKIKYHEYT
jgi:hypothetical protein